MTATELRPLPERPESLTEQVFESIRDNIVDKTLKPGARISEARLAAQLNVSKTPVREALLRLRHIGLVELVDGRLRVVHPSVKAIRDAYEYRAGIERTAAHYAANRAATEDHEHILMLAHASVKHAQARDVVQFRKADREFHEAIAACARNDVLERSIKDSHILTSALRKRDVPISEDPMVSVGCAKEHVGIAEAIRAGDAEAAGRAIADHIHHVMAVVLATHPLPTEVDEKNTEA